MNPDTASPAGCSGKLVAMVSVLFCVALLCYTTTLCPSVYWLDSGELQAAVPTFGIPHSPSFPSYILCSYPICWLPLGDLAYRVNLATAVAAAVVGLLAFFLTRRLMITGKWFDDWVSLGVALFVISNPLSWYQSIKAEVYSLNTVWLLSILIWIAGILRQPDEKRDNFRRFCLIGLFLGLGGTNHSLLTFHIIPAILLLGVFMAKRLRLREIMVAVLAGIMTLSIYLYLPIRSRMEPGIDIGNPENYLNFINAITRRGSFGRFFGNAGSEWWENFRIYHHMMNEHFSWIFFWIGCLGLLMLIRRSPRQGLLLLTVAGSNLAVTLMNRNFNMNPDTGPAYLMISSITIIIGTGVVLRSTLSWLDSRMQSRIPVWCALIGIFCISSVWAAENLLAPGKADSSAGSVGRAILDTCPQDSILYFGFYYNLPFVVSYLQSVEQYRTDIIGISRAELVYWAGGLENLSKRYPELTESIFSNEAGDKLRYLARLGARHSELLSYDEARNLLFNAIAWMAQDQSRTYPVFWISSEDDHLLRKSDITVHGPMLHIGRLPIDNPDDPFDASMMIMERVQAQERSGFGSTRGARVLAAFYDQQCVTLSTRKLSGEAGDARNWRMLYDPLLAGFCEESGSSAARESHPAE